MDRELEMKELLSHMRELVSNFELQARREVRNDQGQQQFNNVSSEKLPFQQDSYSLIQPQAHSQTQQNLHPSFQKSFQNPHYNNQSCSLDNNPNFFNIPDSIPYSQISAYGYGDHNFQTQEPILYPQPYAHIPAEHGYYSPPYAYMEFQQVDQLGGQQCYDPQPSQKSADAFDAIHAAVKPSPEWWVSRQNVVIQSEVEARKSSAFSHGAGTSWSYQDAVVENNREEEENAFALVDAAEALAWKLNQEAKEWEVGAEKGQFREEEQFEQKEIGEREKSFSWSFLHTEQNLPLQKEYGITSRAEQEASLREACERGEAESDVYLTEPGLLQHVEEKEMEEDDYLLYPMFRKGEELIAYFPCEGGIFLQSTLGEEGEAEENDDELEVLLLKSAQQQEEKARAEKKLAVLELPLLLREGEEAIADIACGSHLQSAHGQQEKQQQQEEEEEKKKLDALHDLHMLEGQEEAEDELMCEAFDIPAQEMQNLLQHEPSRNEEGENLQPSPYSFQLCSIKEKGVESFTCAESALFLHEESYNKAGQHQAKEKRPEKQEEEKGTAPDLRDKEAAELLYPQEATPRLEGEAAYPLSFKSLSSGFTLTHNHFSLVSNVYISGVRLQVQQLNLKVFYKLQPTEPCGDVYKKGARGDGVPWFIKVHPP